MEGKGRRRVLREAVAKNPDDALAYFMLATELFKESLYSETVSVLETYLKLAQDEGAAYKMMGDCLAQLGKKKQARWAFRHGAQAARAHDNPHLLTELEDRLGRL